MILVADINEPNAQRWVTNGPEKLSHDEGLGSVAADIAKDGGCQKGIWRRQYSGQQCRLDIHHQGDTQSY